MELFLKKYMGLCKAPMFIGLCVGFGATAVKLSIPVFVGQLIDSGVLAKNSENLVFMIVWIFFYGIVGSGLWVVCKILFQQAGYRTGKQIRWDLYQSMEALSLGEIEQIGCKIIGQSMAEDTECIENFISMYLPKMIYLIFSVVGSIFVSFHIHGNLGILYFLVMFLFFLLVLGKKRMKKKWQEWGRTLCGAIAALSFPVSLCFCLMWMDRGKFTIGNTATFFMYLYPIRKTALFVEVLQGKYQLCKETFMRIDSILNVPTEIKEGKIPFSNHSEINTPQIVFEDVTFKKEGKNILQHFNLEISSGECVGICMEEEKGNAVTYLLPRFYEVYSGEIKMDGLSITQYTFQDLRNQIGIVRKQDRLYIGTFYENLIAGNYNASIEEMETALEAVGMLKTVEQWPRGLRTPIWKSDEHIVEQRLFCIARMLLKEPAILVFNGVWDESDDTTVEMPLLLEGIRKAYPYITILLIDSREENLAGCDRIVKNDGSEG